MLFGNNFWEKSTYFYVDSFGEKKINYWFGGGELIFYIQEIWISSFFVFSSQKRLDWYFQKGFKETFIKIKYCLFKSNLLCKNFLDCQQNED